MNKSKKPINTKLFIITIMALFITSILLFVIYAVMQVKKPDKKAPAASPSAVPTEEAVNKNETAMLAVIREADSELYVITLTNAETGETDMYTYTGATDVKDKYGKILSAKQLEIGEMVDVIYDQISKRISKIQISSEIWEYSGIKNLLFNTEKQVISFLGDRYKYDDGILVLDNGEETILDGFNKRDAFTIRGYGYKICSIVLTRGHGYLKLMDAEKFIGGNIYIGNRIWKQIVEDMVITVPEGVYDVTVEYGDYSGTEAVKINRHETITFYAGGYAPAAESTGRVYYNIFPDGANLYIDNILRDYSGPIELTYGLHTVEVTMGGYKTYTRSITINKTESSYSISLSQTLPGEEDTSSTGNESNNGSQAEISAAPTGKPSNNTEGTSGNDTTSEVPVKIDDDRTITIFYTSGTEVYFDGTYVGEVENGRLVVPKYIGTFEIDLYLEGYDIVSYTMEVADDNENVEITIPGLN